MNKHLSKEHLAIKYTKEFIILNWQYKQSNDHKIMSEMHRINALYKKINGDGNLFDFI